MGLPMPSSQNNRSGSQNTCSVASNNRPIPARTSFSMNRAFGGLQNIGGHSTVNTPGVVSTCVGGHIRAVTLPSLPGGKATAMKNGVVFKSAGLNSAGCGPEGSSMVNNGSMGRGFSSSKSKEVAGGAIAAVSAMSYSLHTALNTDKASSEAQQGAIIGKTALATKASNNRPSLISTATSNGLTSTEASHPAACSVALTSEKSIPGHAASLPLPGSTVPATQTHDDADLDPRVLDFKTPDAAVGVPNTPYANFSRSSNFAATELPSCQEMLPSSATCSSGNVSPRLPSDDAPCTPVYAPSAVRGLAGTARPRLCIGCGSDAAVRCSVCKAGYCSSDCQHEDWHYHRKECQPPPPLEEYSFTVPNKELVAAVKVKQEPMSPPPFSAQHVAPHNLREEPSRAGQEQVARLQQEAYLLEQRHQLNGGRSASELSASVVCANEAEKSLQQPKPVNVCVALSEAEAKPVTAAVQSMVDASKMNDNVQISAVKKSDSAITKQDEMPAVLKKDYPVGSAIRALKLASTYSAMVTTIHDVSCFSLLVFVEGTENMLQVGSVQLDDCPVVTGFSPKVGQLVAAQSLHDATWCRSYVFGISDSSYQVCHIDFGYIETVVAVKPMPEGMCWTAPGTGLCAVLDHGVNNDAQALTLLIKNECLVHFRVTATDGDSVTAVVLDADGHDIGTYLLQSWYEGIASLSTMEQTHDEEVLPGVAPCSADKTPTMKIAISSRNALEDENTPTATVKSAQPNPRDNSFHLQHPKSPTVSNAVDESFGPDEISSTRQPGPGAANKARCGVSSSAGGRRGGGFMLGDLKQLSLDIGERYPMMPVWCIQDFLFVQLHTEQLVEMFRKLMANISDHCALSSSPNTVHVGELVCGFIEADCLWYRALVVQVDPKSSAPALVSLYFVDFGSTEQIALHHVRPFIRPFLDVPVMCIKVGLCGDPPMEGAPLQQLTGVYEILKDLVEVSGQLLMHVVAKKSPPSATAEGAPKLEWLLVRIFDKDGLLCVNDTVLCMGIEDGPPEVGGRGVAVAQHQGKEEVAQLTPTVAPGVDAANGVSVGDSSFPAATEDVVLKPNETTNIKTDLQPAHLMYEDCDSLNMEPGENVDLVVLTASNTHTIMVIPHKDIGLMEELETLSAALNDYCNSLKTVYYEPADGEVVLAKFSQDGLWYRAACLTTVPAEGAAIVQFVDYGNVETVLFDCLVQMLSSFVRPLPFLALHTLLEGSGAQPSSKEGCSARLAELLPPFSCVTAARVSAQDPDTLTHAIALPQVLETLRAEQLLE